MNGIGSVTLKDVTLRKSERLRWRNTQSTYLYNKLN